MKKPSNYVKLSVSALGVHDDEAVSPRLCTDGTLSMLVSWVWTFTTKAEAAAALMAAQAKRLALRERHPAVPEEAFQLSQLRTSSLRGVPLVGSLRASALSLAEAS